VSSALFVLLLVLTACFSLCLRCPAAQPFRVARRTEYAYVPAVLLRQLAGTIAVYGCESTCCLCEEGAVESGLSSVSSS